MRLRYILIYDDTCAFCEAVAQFLVNRYRFELEIVPYSFGSHPYLGKFPDEYEKDVHLVMCDMVGSRPLSFLTFVGASAAVRVVGIEYPILVKAYRIKIFKIIIDSLYYLVKKTRKYISYFI